LVKGGDYGLDQIHGREEVEAAGGRVISLPFVEGSSTTSIINKMKTMSDML
jgi:D-beta-D-heptose 7-phosphate kinase/D-beta-D-heptose 1-phosphate adenosyltransferase